MLDFQKYQIEFTAHVRDPKNNARPAKVKDARMAVYREIVFNNIFASVSACFPVGRAILGKRAWLKLTKQFFASHQATTPIFREIPEEFLKFLTTTTDLPDYLEQLAHYEWVELAVNMQDFVTPKLSKKMELLHKRPVLAPANMLLEYDYPVHKISEKFKPANTEKTYLFVFRNSGNQVKFIELNPITYLLLSLLRENQLTGEQALIRLAEGIQHPDVNMLIKFGSEILQDLAKQDAIIGSA